MGCSASSSQRWFYIAMLWRVAPYIKTDIWQTLPQRQYLCRSMLSCKTSSFLGKSAMGFNFSNKFPESSCIIFATWQIGGPISQYLGRWKMTWICGHIEGNLNVFGTWKITSTFRKFKTTSMFWLMEDDINVL